MRSDLEGWTNRVIIDAIQTGSDPAAGSPVATLYASLQGSVERVQQKVLVELAPDRLQERERHLRSRLETALKDDTWQSSFRGRDILKRFTNRYGNGIAYEVIRNLIIAKMRDQTFQPPGMKKVIEAILNG